MLFSDEVERSDQGALTRRLQSAKVDHDQVLERFDWDAKITLDRDRLKALIGLDWMDRKENVIFTGPVGVGKTFIANAMAHVCLSQEQERRYHQGGQDVQESLCRPSR